MITPLCLSLLLTVCPSSSVGLSHPPALGDKPSGEPSSFRSHSSAPPQGPSSTAAVWLSAPQAAAASGAPPPPPLTLGLTGLFLTLFLVPFLPVQRFLSFLNYVFPAVPPVRLIHCGSAHDRADPGQLLDFSHRQHPCSSLASLVTDTPHLNTSSFFSCSTFKVLQCWLPHFKSHICLQSINNLI